MTNETDLIQRLRGPVTQAAKDLINDYFGNSDKTLASIPADPRRDADIVLLDGLSQATDALEAAQARIAELEEALTRIDEASNHYAMTPTYSEGTLRYAHKSTRNLARAALEGKG